MAKKNPKNIERRAMVEKMRAEQARKERARSLAILGVCVLVVVALIGTAAFKVIQDHNRQKQIDGTPVQNLGVSASAAACDQVITRVPTGLDASGATDPTTKEGNHVPTGTKITYAYAPPAFGRHWPNFLQSSEYRGFYTTKDRPELERMVHSLEHGHTLIWYDDTVKPGSKAYQDLQTIADKYAGTTTYVNVLPWESTDGAAFPAGKHVVLTHWEAKGSKQDGVWQYCGKPSGSVIKDFVKKYPNTDAPEAGAI